MQFCAACGEITTMQPCAACGGDPLLGGRYALRELLGQGSHGMTWRADRDGEVVAIKVINLGHGLQDDAQQALDREVSVLRQLSHPRIPGLIDDFSTRSGMTRYRCIVQAFIDGPNLLDALESTRYTPAEVMLVIAEIADILDHLHGLTPPIIHRDIKPQNLILRAADQALVLIDFGSVRDTLVGTLGGTMSVGTVGYMAPEQITGEVCPGSDLFALGALAVHLLTRQPPLLTHDPSDPIRWRRPDGLPDRIGALVDALLQRRPEDRPEGAAVVAQQARILAADPRPKPLPAPSPPEPPPAPSPPEPPPAPSPPEPPPAPSPPVPAPEAALSMRPLLVLYPLLGVLSIVAAMLSLVTIESIMFTGGIGSVLGLIVVLVAAPRRQLIGMLTGLSALGVSLFVLLLIALTGMSPVEASAPIPPLLGGYTFVLLPSLIIATGRALAAQQAQRLAQPVTPAVAAAGPRSGALPAHLPILQPVIGSRREREALKALAQEWQAGVVPEDRHVCPFCGARVRPSALVDHYDAEHLPAASAQRRQQQHLS